MPTVTQEWQFPGEFGAAGGLFITYDWDPEPEVVQRRMAELAGYYDNIEPAMLAIQEIAKEETKERFRTETDPWNAPWPPLDPQYLSDKIAAGFPEDILVRTTDLREMAPEAWEIVGPVLHYDVSQIPYYGPYHQTGSGSENAGFAAGATKYQRRRGLGIGRGNALPARPFIGLGPDAVAKIEAFFLEWVIAGVDGPQWDEIWPPEYRFTSVPAFGGGFMLRGAGGRFTGVYGR